MLSKSTPTLVVHLDAGGTNSCFLNQPLRRWYIPTLEAQPHAGGTDQRCAWTGFWSFWTRTPVASNSIRSEVLFPVAGSGLDLDFVFTEENITVCLLDLYISGLKQESDYLNLFGTGWGLDSDSQFAKQDWSRTQRNQSPNTSSTDTAEQSSKDQTRGVQQASRGPQPGPPSHLVWPLPTLIFHRHFFPHHA